MCRTLVSALALVVGFASPAFAQKITTFDVPGAFLTNPVSIGSDGQIVGCYQIGITTHGFLRNTEGTFVSLDPPGATFSYARAVSDTGQVLGGYVDSNFVNHGFLWSPDGEYTTIDVGSGSTYPIDMNPAGDITGISASQGFLRKADGTVTLFMLGSATFPIAINSANQITGSYNDDTGEHGFVRDPDGTFVSFEIGIEGTFPHSINSAGVVAGLYYYGVRSRSRGFLRSPGGGIVTFGRLGSPATSAVGINSAGTIAGWYEDSSGGQHGLVRTANGTATTIDLPGALFTSAVDINRAGTVVGQYVDALGDHGFIATK